MKSSVLFKTPSDIIYSWIILQISYCAIPLSSSDEVKEVISGKKIIELQVKVIYRKKGLGMLGMSFKQKEGNSGQSVRRRRKAIKMDERYQLIVV